MNLWHFPTVDTDWNELGNWYSSVTSPGGVLTPGTPAAAIPTAADAVFITASVESNSGPPAVALSVDFLPEGTYNAIDLSAVVGTVTFQSNGGGGSINYGTVKNFLFLGTSNNGIGGVANAVSGGIFQDDSFNLGQVTNVSVTTFFNDNFENRVDGADVGTITSASEGGNWGLGTKSIGGVVTVGNGNYPGTLPAGAIVQLEDTDGNPINGHGGVDFTIVAFPVEDYPVVGDVKKGVVFKSGTQTGTYEAGINGSAILGML